MKVFTLDSMLAMVAVSLVFTVCSSDSINNSFSDIAAWSLALNILTISSQREESISALKSAGVMPSSAVARSGGGEGESLQGKDAAWGAGCCDRAGETLVFLGFGGTSASWSWSWRHTWRLWWVLRHLCLLGRCWDNCVDLNTPTVLGACSPGWSVSW